MSDMGAIMDAIGTAAEGAVTGLVAERGIRVELNSEEKPRLFLYNPTESVELADHQQEQVATGIEGALFVSDTQENLATMLDDIRDAIRADKTLGGVVRWAYVAERGIAESDDPLDRIGILAFVTQQEN